MSHSAMSMPRDRVGERAAMPHPERVLVQLLGDAHRLDRALADHQRPQHGERRLDQPRVGEDAADAHIGRRRS